MEEHTKLVIEILLPMAGMVGWTFKNLSKKIEEVKTDLKENTKEIRKLDRRLQKIEDRLEFSNKVVYVQHQPISEDMKES